MDIAAGHYDAPATSLDFAAHNAEALALINDWVSDTTSGLIPTLLESLSPDTLVVLLNAVLLDATWQETMTERGPLDFTDGGWFSVHAGTLVRLYRHRARWHRTVDGLDCAGARLRRRRYRHAAAATG